MLSSLLALAVFATPVFATPVFAASAENWQKRSIYQLVTDRFATSDGSAPPCDTGERKYCNGTWQGVINQLSYIQDMGFDAIWISPVVANLEGDTGDGEAYHGYWAVDQNTLNSHFGTDGDLKLLAETLHQRGMYLMLDVVVNHMAADTLPPNYASFTPFDNQSDFHPFCWITDYNNQTNVEQCWLGDTNVPLVDNNTEDDDIVEFFNDWIKDLVNTYNADGVRIDTVKHIRKDFWPAFVAAAGVFSVGEVLSGDVQYVANYTGYVDSVLDYPTYYPLVRAFNGTSGNLTELAETVKQSQKAYRLGEFMTGSFLENADNPRFQSFETDQALVKNAMTWPFIQDGIPILYYGQEQGYTGGDDPYNREALWLSGYVMDKPLVIHVRTLNAARKAAIDASSDYLNTAVEFASVSESSMAVVKSPMLTLLTNGGSGSTPSWSVADANYSAGEALIDVLTCDEFKADKNGGVSVQGENGMPKVVLPVSVFNSTYCNHLLSDVSGNTSASGMPTSGVAGMAVRLSMVIAAALAVMGGLVLGVVPGVV